MTSWNYLYAVLGSHVPGYAKDLLWTYFAIGVLGLVVLVVLAIVNAIIKRRQERLAKQSAEKKQKIAAPSSEERPQKLSAPRRIYDRLGGSLEFKQKVKRAMYWSFGYAIVSVLGAAVFARTSPQQWDQPDTLVTAAFIATVAWVLVVAPVPLFYLLVRCSPPFGDGGPGQGQERPAPRYPRRRADTTRSPARKPRSRQRQPRQGPVRDHRRRPELHVD
jgi:hypothetical protein